MFGWIGRVLTRGDVDRDTEDPEGLPVRVTCYRCLSPAAFEAAGGERDGRAHWWLQHEAGWFAGVELPRGDEPVDQVVRLEPGRYTLGVGTGRDAIRKLVIVRAPA